LNNLQRVIRCPGQRGEKAGVNFSYSLPEFRPI
jgi:hypothetical protein